MTEWRGYINLDGGPLLLADLEDFRHWTGCEPLPLDERTELHFYSPFTDELPKKFQPNGPNGHQYLPASDIESLISLRDELTEFVQTRWPGSTVETRFDRHQVRRSDGRILAIELYPDSEYSRAIRSKGVVRLHHFGDGACGLFWATEPGSPNLILSADRKRLLMVEIYWDNEGEYEQAVLNHALGASSHEHPIEFIVESGTVVAVWSPQAYGDLRRPVVLEPLTLEDEPVMLTLTTGNSGCLMPMVPGRYRVLTAEHETDSWRASWCRVERIDAG